MTSSFEQPLRVGIIGCGYATSDRHLPALARIREAEVVAVADVEEAALREVGERWDIARRYRSALDLVADPNVDVVAVCVPAALHVEMALAALTAAKHVLVEKPLSLTLKDADELIEQARQTSAKVLMGFNLRWHALIREARTVLRDGLVGPVVHIRTTFSDPLLTQDNRVPPWRVERRLGGGALLDKAVHHFDLWRFLLEDEIEEVFALSRSKHGEDDVVSVTARTKGGVHATALASDTTSVHNEVTIFGEAGELSVCCYRFDGLALTQVSELPGGARTRIRKFARAAMQLGPGIRAARTGGIFARSYDAEWRHFAEVIRAGAEPGCRLEDGREALVVALAAARSAATGQPVKVAGAPGAVTPARGVADAQPIAS